MSWRVAGFPCCRARNRILKERDRDLQKGPLTILLPPRDVSGQENPAERPLLSQRKSDGKPHCVSGRAERKEAAGCRRLLYMRGEERKGMAGEGKAGKTGKAGERKRKQREEESQRREGNTGRGRKIKQEAGRKKDRGRGFVCSASTYSRRSGCMRTPTQS